MNVSENVHQDIINIIPAGLISDITCYVFHDKHPKDEKYIDITVCTKGGELREYFQRDLQLSLNLNCVIEKSSELRILRNNNSELFYLLSTNSDLFIISSIDKLRVHEKFTNIDRYDVNDTACSGEICLKIVKKDDAVPLLFNSNFECLEDLGFISNQHKPEDAFPIFDELKRKLVEARYTTKCNEKTYAHYLNLHQKASLLSYQKQQPASSSIFQDDLKIVPGGLKLKTHKPWVKVCNKKIVVILNVLNQCEEPLENIHILLHSAIPSLVYRTRVYAKVPSLSPYWQETDTHKLILGQECMIAAIVPLKEFKQNVFSQIELSGCIVYKKAKQEFSVPFEDVVVSSTEVMGDEIDVLSSCNTNDYNTIVAILAATEKTELLFRHIRQDNEPEGDILNLFCTHLQMDRVENAPNVIVYKKSPYHVLNGTMLIFQGNMSDNPIPVSVHTRSLAQVPALLRCIYDAVPAKIICTTPTYKITAKTDLSHYNEDISTPAKQLNYSDYGTSMLNRSTKILKHLDDSMIKMNESKNSLVQSKVGSHIDLFAGGVDTFKKFRDNMINEAIEGIELMKSNVVDSTQSNVILPRDVSESNEGVYSFLDSPLDGSAESDVMYIG